MDTRFPESPEAGSFAPEDFTAKVRIPGRAEAGACFPVSIGTDTRFPAARATGHTRAIDPGHVTNPDSPRGPGCAKNPDCAAGSSRPVLPEPAGGLDDGLDATIATPLTDPSCEVDPPGSSSARGRIRALGSSRALRWNRAADQRLATGPPAPANRVPDARFLAKIIPQV